MVQTVQDDRLRKILERPYWEQVLDEAEERVARGERPFTDEEAQSARSWQTCACGMQDIRIPRYGADCEVDGRAYWKGQPKDEQLQGYGMDFALYVCGANRSDVPLECINDARKAMKAIEARSPELLSGLQEEGK